MKRVEIPASLARTALDHTVEPTRRGGTICLDEAAEGRLPNSRLSRTP
jgi:hypothetical protein